MKQSMSFLVFIMSFFVVRFDAATVTALDDLEACVADWRVADVDNSGAIERSEYLTLITATRNRECRATDSAPLQVQNALTLQQQAAFTSLACQCLWDENDETNDSDATMTATGTTNDCCLNDKAKLPLPPTDVTTWTETQFLFAKVVCTVTQQTLGEDCVLANDEENDESTDPSDVVTPLNETVAALEGYRASSPDRSNSVTADNNNNDSGNAMEGWWWLLVVGLLAMIVVLICCIAIYKGHEQEQKRKQAVAAVAASGKDPSVASGSSRGSGKHPPTHQQMYSDEEEGMTLESAVDTHEDDEYDEHDPNADDQQDVSIRIYGDGDPSETEHTQTTTGSAERGDLRIVGVAETGGTKVSKQLSSSSEPSSSSSSSTSTVPTATSGQEIGIVSYHSSSSRYDPDTSHRSQQDDSSSLHRNTSHRQDDPYYHGSSHRDSSHQSKSLRDSSHRGESSRESSHRESSHRDDSYHHERSHQDSSHRDESSYQESSHRDESFRESSHRDDSSRYATEDGQEIAIASYHERSARNLEEEEEMKELIDEDEENVDDDETEGNEIMIEKYDDVEPLVQGVRDPWAEKPVSYKSLQKANKKTPKKRTKKPAATRRKSPPRPEDASDTGSQISFGLWEALDKAADESNNSSRADLNNSATSSSGKVTKKKKNMPPKKPRRGHKSQPKPETADAATTSSHTSFGLWDVLDNADTSHNSSKASLNEAKEEEKVKEPSSPTKSQHPSSSQTSRPPRRYSTGRLDELPSTEKEKPPTPEKDDDPTLEESESTAREEGRPVQEDNTSYSFDWIFDSLKSSSVGGGS